MHAISSYRSNRPTNTQTHRQDRSQYTAPLSLARSVTSSSMSRNVWSAWARARHLVNGGGRHTMFLLERSETLYDFECVSDHVGVDDYVGSSVHCALVPEERTKVRRTGGWDYAQERHHSWSWRTTTLHRRLVHTVRPQFNNLYSPNKWQKRRIKKSNQKTKVN